jgi:leader peptidase (prepilin peptidase)/N-methyltransferase
LISFFILIPLFLCWGSFLNVIGYRIIRNINICWPRSFCTQCKHTLTWYDLLPIVSWIMLAGKCRYCRKHISFLYPFIEILTAVSMTALFLTTPTSYLFAYFIFFSALIITIRTDFEMMLISRFLTIFLVPIVWLMATLNLLPISLTESILGSIFGYFFLFCIAKIFAWWTKKEGMGQGDFEFLACIGAFIGPLGCWITLLIASTLGSILGLLYIIIFRPGANLRIPFGPFLAFGAIIYTIFQDYFAQLMFLS